MIRWHYLLAIVLIVLFATVFLAAVVSKTIDRRRKLKRLRTIRLKISRICKEALEEEADEEVYS